MQKLICPKCGCNKIKTSNMSRGGTRVQFVCTSCGLSLKRENTAACRKYWNQKIDTHLCYVLRNLVVYKNVYIGDFLCNRYSKKEIRQYIKTNLGIKIKFIKPELLDNGMIIQEI
jgi:predicted RNA-binding Zn-ribbon protein involved in translation (DUF1610 family)